MGKTSLLVIGRFGFFLLAGNSMLIVRINTKRNNESPTPQKSSTPTTKTNRKLATQPTPPRPTLHSPPHPTPTPTPTPPHPLSTDLPKLTKATRCGGLAFSVLQLSLVDTLCDTSFVLALLPTALKGSSLEPAAGFIGYRLCRRPLGLDEWVPGCLDACLFARLVADLGFV